MLRATRSFFLSALLVSGLSCCTVTYHMSPGSDSQVGTVDCAGPLFSGDRARIIDVDGVDIRGSFPFESDPMIVKLAPGPHTVTILVPDKTQMYPAGFIGNAPMWTTHTTFKKIPLAVNISAGDYYRCQHDTIETGFLWRTEKRYALGLDRERMLDNDLSSLSRSIRR